MRLAWARAPRAALSSPVTIVVAAVAALVVAFIAASTVFHVSASGSAAVQYVVDSRCPDDTGLTVERATRGYLGARPDASFSVFDERMREAAAQNGLDSVRRTRFGSTVPLAVGDKQVDGRLVARDGAFENTPVLDGGGTDGAWVPKELADDFGVRVGDTLSVTTDAGVLTVPVTGVYPTFTDPVSDFWCSQRTELISLVAVPERTIRPPAVIVSPETLDRLVDQGLTISIDRVQFTYTELPADRQRADALAAAVAALRVDLDHIRVPGLTAQRAAESTLLSDRAGYPAASGARAQQAVGSSLLPLTGVSLVVGLAAVAGLALMWSQRRFGEVRLLWTRGVPPAAIGGKAALEMLAPLAVGAAAGWAVARLSVGVLTPAAAVDPWAPWGAAIAAAVGLGACVGVLAVAVTLRVRRLFQPARAPRTRVAKVLRWAPWEVAVAALAGYSWQRLADGALVVSRADLLPRVDVIALMFPLLVLAVLLGVASRVAALGLRLGHRARRWRLPMAQWGLRRAAAQARLTVGLLAIAGLAVGVVAVGVGVSDTERQAVADKGRMFVGSDTAVRLAESIANPTDRPDLSLPGALGGRSTHVAVRDVRVGDGDVRILAVDPATFADGVTWRPTWADGAQLGDLLARLGPATDGRVPAILLNKGSGGARPYDPQDLTPDGFTGVDVVGTVDQFPGVVQSDAMLIVSWDGMFGGDPRGYTRYVFSRAPADQVTSALEAAGVRTTWAYTGEGANDALPFLVVAWTFDYFVTLGAVLAAVAVTALLLAIEARRRATAVAHGLLARMGLRMRGMFGSYVAELSGLAVAAAALGLLGGWFVLATASARLDPAPWLAPEPVPVSLLPLTVLITVAAAAAVALVAAYAARSAARAPVRELLRAGAE